MSVSSRLRQLLTGLGLGYLGLAAWNAQVDRRTRNLELPLPLEGETGSYDWPGGRIAYTRRGQGEPVLLVHGVYAGADSHEFGGIFGPLSEGYQIYAYDLLGFGHSARPDVRYSGPLYVRLMVDFVRDVIKRPTTVIASSLSGGYAMLGADEERDLIRRLILATPTGTTAGGGPASMAASATYLAFTLLPDLGQAAKNGIASRASIRWYLRNMAFYDPTKATPELVDYSYRSAHQPGAEHALIAFVTGRLDIPVGEALRSLRQPVSLFWGRQARVTPLNQAWRYLSIRPDATLHVIDRAGLDLLEEQPQEFVRQALEVLAGREAAPSGEQAAAEAQRQQV